MSLVQVTPANETPHIETTEEQCECCVNGIRVAVLKRQRHAAWLARGEKRGRVPRD